MADMVNRYEENYWLNACLHILICGRSECLRCDKIKSAIETEKTGAEAEHEG